MKFSWSNNVLPIALIFSFRMLGLFMLIPVFTISASTLSGATSTLIGIALGSYGLSQGILQIPYGLLSDKFGRKPILKIGLILFIVGSLLGAQTNSIYGVILARIIQGAGAIGSVLIALLADLSPEKERTKAMAIIGMTIGISFMLAMIVSPIINQYFGLSGIFTITALLASVGLMITHFWIPTPEREYFHAENETNTSLLKSVFFDLQLQRLNAGILIQHWILTSTFFALPLILHQQIKLGYLQQQWHFYLPIMLFAFIAMLPFIVIAEKKQQMKPVFLFSIFIITVSQACLAISHKNWTFLCAFMLLYFIAFNVLEASLPSLISKIANKKSKGTAMGIYSSNQFLGIFLGGSFAGITYKYGGFTAIFYFNAIVSLFWFTISLALRLRKNN